MTQQRIPKSSKLYPLLNDAVWLRRRYHDNQKTMGEIALEVGGCSVVTVLHAMRRFGIESRDAKKAGRGKTGRHPQFKNLHDRDWLAEKRREGMTATAISRLLGCSFSMACRAIRKAGLANPTPLLNPSESPFYGKKEKLNDEDWMVEQYVLYNRTAADITAELVVPLWEFHNALARLKITKYPTKKVEQDNGRISEKLIRKQGYILEYRPSHPAANRRGYVWQHRLVVEQEIGRYLVSTEEVHHLNENREDNRLDNLLVMPDHGSHRCLHTNQPPWIPCCGCCNQPRAELVKKRPSWVPLIYDKEKTYSIPADASSDELEAIGCGSKASCSASEKDTPTISQWQVEQRRLERENSNLKADKRRLTGDTLTFRAACKEWKIMHERMMASLGLPDSADACRTALKIGQEALAAITAIAMNCQADESPDSAPAP